MKWTALALLFLTLPAIALDACPYPVLKDGIYKLSAFPSGVPANFSKMTIKTICDGGQVISAVGVDGSAATYTFDCSSGGDEVCESLDNLTTYGGVVESITYKSATEFWYCQDYDAKVCWDFTFSH